MRKDSDRIQTLVNSYTTEELISAISLQLHRLKSAPVSSRTTNRRVIPYHDLEEIVYNSFSQKPYKILLRVNITRIYQLAQCSRAELLGIRGFGEACLSEAEEILGRHGHQLFSEDRSALARDLQAFCRKTLMKGPMTMNSVFMNTLGLSMEGDSVWPYISVYEGAVFLLRSRGFGDPESFLAENGFVY